MRSLPRASMTCHLVPPFPHLRSLIPKKYDVPVLIPLASTPFHVLSQRFTWYGLALFSTAKGKHIKASTGPSKRAFSTKGNNLGASAEGGNKSGTPLSAPEASNDQCWFPRLACMHSSAHVRAFRRTVARTRNTIKEAYFCHFRF